MKVIVKDVEIEVPEGFSVTVRGAKVTINPPATIQKKDAFERFAESQLEPVKPGASLMPPNWYAGEPPLMK